MKVRDIMNPSPPTVAPHARISEVSRVVLEGDDEGAAVIDAAGELVGVVTEDDLVSKHARVHAPLYLGILGGVLPLESHRTDIEIRHVLSVCARDIMSTDRPTLAPDADVDDAASLMVEKRVNPIMVVENGAVVGIISHKEIIRLLIREETGADDDE